MVIVILYKIINYYLGHTVDVASLYCLRQWIVTVILGHFHPKSTFPITTIINKNRSNPIYKTKTRKLLKFSYSMICGIL